MKVYEQFKSKLEEIGACDDRSHAEQIMNEVRIARTEGTVSSSEHRLLRKQFNQTFPRKQRQP